MRLIDESTALLFFSTMKLGLSIVLYSETDHFLALIKMQINIQTAARVSVRFNMALHLRANHYFITHTQNEKTHVSSCCMPAGEINLLLDYRRRSCVNVTSGTTSCFFYCVWWSTTAN